MAGPTSLEEAGLGLLLVLDENLVRSSCVWNKTEPTSSAYTINSYTAQALYSLIPRIPNKRSPL